MTAKELRIGNWVMYNDKNTEPIPHPVKIDISDLLLLQNGVKECVYNPIPLTPEILEKCDFYGTNFPAQLSVSNNGNYYWGNGINIEVKSLHQLQNLYFALTAEELIIYF